MNTFYDGAAKVGKAKSIAGMVIGIIAGVIFIGIAIYMLTHMNKNLQSGIANIVKATCNQVINKSNNTYSMSYSCSLDISYVVNNKEYKGTIVTNGSNSYLTGGTVEISYDINNPLNVSEKKTSSILFGVIFIIVGILLSEFVGIFSTGAKPTFLTKISFR